MERIVALKLKCNSIDGMPGSVNSQMNPTVSQPYSQATASNMMYQQTQYQNTANINQKPVQQTPSQPQTNNPYTGVKQEIKPGEKTGTPIVAPYVV